MSYNLDAIAEMITSIERKYSHKDIRTGLPELDACMDLPESGGFGIICGERSCGKTSLILEIAHSLAVIQNVPIILFSGGLPSKIILRRLLSVITGISVDLLRKGGLSLAKFELFRKSCEQLVESPLLIIDEIDVSYERLMASMEKIPENFKPSLILIDNVQSMNEDLAETAIFLKQFSEFIKLPVIAVLQNNTLPVDAINAATIVLEVAANGTELQTLKNSYGPMTVLPLKERK